MRSFWLFLTVGLASVPALASDADMAPALSEKFVGNIVGLEDHGLPKKFTSYWDQVTLENNGKWVFVEKERDVMTWETLDAQVAAAQEAGLPIKQHAFIWGMSEPRWLEGLPYEEQRAEVEEWMRAFAQRYPDIEMVDVVNEPITIPPKYHKDAIGGDGETGWDWVIWAYELARELYPDATLILNEHSTLRRLDKRQRFQEIIALLQERGLVDAIGLQAHWIEGLPSRRIVAGLDDYAKFGLPIYISELDFNADTDGEQLATMSRGFPILFEHPAVHGITFWGYREGELWQKKAYLLNADGTPRPALAWLHGYLAGIRAGATAEE
ncbi:MAG: endo-1,4-beta-xylanase [Opitutales bacterium]